MTKAKRKSHCPPLQLDEWLKRDDLAELDFSSGSF